MLYTRSDKTSARVSRRLKGWRSLVPGSLTQIFLGKVLCLMYLLAWSETSLCGTLSNLRESKDWYHSKQT